MEHFDVAVVGCGAMGSSVSYNLASRGSRVLTLERFHLNHDFGSSHGGTRIIRLAYAEDPRYVPLLRRAFVSWKELERASGRNLMRLTGGLMIGRSDGELVSGVMRSAKEHGLPHRVMTAAEVNREYPAFRVGEDQTAVYEQNAGILYPEECLSAFHEGAERAGSTFRFSEPASTWKGTEDGIEVTTGKGTYRADKLVICAGAWNRELLGDLIPLECERQVPLWFDPAGNENFTPDKMPVFVQEEDDATYYGIPDIGEGVKVARHHAGELVRPDSVDREVSESDISPVRDFIIRRLSGLVPTPVLSKTCLYTNTPDSNFVVDYHPDDSRVVVVSACSGHGFKFSSVIGEVVADLVRSGETPHGISFLKVSRFRKD